jgi:hypothetical protein
MLLPRPRRGPGAAAGTTIGAGSRDRGASGARVVAAGRRARGGAEAFSQPRRAFPAAGIPGASDDGAAEPCSVLTAENSCPGIRGQ